jgi:hypothetical protein
LEKFLELFTPQPGYKILDITAHTDALSEALLRRLIPVHGRLGLAQYPGEHRPLEPLGEVMLQRQSVPDFSKPFRALPRDNDIVFLRDVLHRHTQPERMLKAVYTTLANAAEIIIVTESGAADTEAQLAMLEKADFRAANVIEGLAEGVTVVMGKKMHMWGNGL